MRLVDSHCHIQADRFDTDADLVLGAARLAGVERVLVPGWDRFSGERALALAERLPWLDAAVGVHPHEAARVDRDAWRWFEATAADPRVVAIGETGLDYDRAFSPIPDQIANLRRNLELALAVGKPAILHCRSAAGRRDAQDALVAELDAAGLGGPDVRAAFGERPAAILHSFSGPLDYAQAMLALDCAISFSGLVFRAGEEPSAAVAGIVPAGRLLTETDAPFLSPPGAPRRRNEPAFVEITARWLSDRRGVPVEALGGDLMAAYDAILQRDEARPRP